VFASWNWWECDERRTGIFPGVGGTYRVATDCQRTFLYDPWRGKSSVFRLSDLLLRLNKLNWAWHRPSGSAVPADANKEPQTSNIAPLLVKVKGSRYRSGVAQRVGRGIALLSHDGGTRRGWVVSSTLRPHFTPGKDPVPILQEAGWAPGPVWTGGKSRPHRD